MNATRLALLFIVLFGLVAPAARAEEPATAEAAAARASLVRGIKQLQVRQFQAKARRVLQGSANFQARAPHGPRRRVDPDLVRHFMGNADAFIPTADRSISSRGSWERVAPLDPERTQAITTNVKVSEPAGETDGSSQNEPSIAARGPYVLCAYNDWASLLSLDSILGYSYSVNGGQSFIDGGGVPSPEGYIWTSDPVITVNEKSGDFFFCGLLEDTLDEEPYDPRNGIGFVRGTFTGIQFHWDTPRAVRIVRSAEHFLDKPWIAADSSTGNVYLSYSDFFPSNGDVSNTIQFARTRDRGLNWDPEIKMNADSANGRVQGSRPVVGPNAEVYVAWKEIGATDPGYDFLRIRRSISGGSSFGSENTIASFFDNFGTGAPGFNREKSVALPSISIDRSRTINRGRIYVAWNESLNWYDDLPGVGPTITETEYNDFFADPDPFTIGQTLLGTFRDDTDYDSWIFLAEQDSSYAFWADSVTGSTYRLRVWCADSLTRLTYTGHPELPLDNDGNQSIMVFTAPSTGLYYLDMTNARIGGRGPGTYRILTGKVRRGAERGRDQRDVFVTTSADGASWTPPVRVNQEPAHFDDWLPEVSAATNGHAYFVWYDWRDAGPTACGGLSSVYAAFSENGGATWNTLGSLSDQLSNWTYVNSNLIPNQGDYLGLYANENSVYTAWTDGRLGTPDIYAGLISLIPVELQVSAVAAAVGREVTIDWQFVFHRTLEATIYRRDPNGQVTLATVMSNSDGHITFVDTTTARGVEYFYSLGIQTDEGERIVGEIVVQIPLVPVLVTPNPMRSSSTISYAVPAGGGDVEVMIHDIGGRRVRSLVRGFRIGGEHQVAWNAIDAYGRLVKSGLYFVRVSVGGKTVSQRITVMP